MSSAKLHTLLDQVTQALQKHVNVRAIFGEPIERKNVTIIPVGKIQLRGGGGGSIARDHQTGDGQAGGMGMGGVADVRPVGYIKVTDDDAEYVEIRDRSQMLIGGVMLGAAALLLLLQVGKQRRLGFSRG
jgi:uncharacterized spore protein YtfJ